MEWLANLVESPRFYILLRSAILLAIGLPVLHLLASGGRRLAKARTSDQAAMLVGKGIFYTGVLLLIIMIMQNLGFKLTAILGAAGIIGVALSFASQTSLSNIISGIFLIWERPFAVGDVIDVNGTVGMVLSIDLLSVKMRTLDNRFLRVPNETIIKSQVITITRFPIRRLDLDIGVAYKEDVDRVMKLLVEIADANPYSLDEPRPLIIFKNFGNSAIEIMLGVWFSKTDLLNLRNSIMCEIKKRFDAEGIEIAFPHVSLYTGSATQPFPVRVVEGNAATPAETASESS